jgi:hypothetical protein
MVWGFVRGKAMTAYHSVQAVLREPPPSAANQCEKTLALLRDAARFGQGVSGDTLRYDHGIRQAPTRIFELKNLYGYQIETVQDPKTRLATYYLRGDPPADWQPSTTQQENFDWYTRATNKPRPTVSQRDLFLWDRRR